MIHHFRLAQSHLPPCYLLHLSLCRCTLIPRDCNQTFFSNGLLVVHQIWDFNTIFIKFTPAKYSIWYDGHYSNTVSRKPREEQLGNMTAPSINPVGLPLSSSGHKVKKLGTKWSKLLGTRTKLTENIKPPYTVWTAGGLWVHGLKNRPATNTSTIQMSCPLQISTEHKDCCWCMMKRCMAATICAAKAFIKLITGGSKHLSDTSLFWVR